MGAVVTRRSGSGFRPFWRGHRQGRHFGRDGAAGEGAFYKAWLTSTASGMESVMPRVLSSMMVAVSV